MVNMGGLQLGNSTIGYGIHGAKESSQAQQSFYQVHWYVYPVIYWLELLVDFLCLEKQSFDVAYITELDPLWNEDELSFILNPEAVLFGNPIAQAACAADCAAGAAVDGDVGAGAGVVRRTEWDGGLEGLEARTGTLHGGEPEGPVVIEEHGVRLEVDIRGGHKTGFYLDQRENRLLARQLAAGRSVLNCFCYTGGFSLQALAGGAASVLSIDSSGPALEGARRNLALNPQLSARRAEWRDADVFEELRALKKAGARFDLIILDPPKFAPSAAHADRAARAYKDINLLGFRLLNPGGLLMTYSCSGGIGIELFHKIIAGAAADAGVDGRILHRLSAAPDHPVGLSVPEGEYLKGLTCQVG